MKSITRRLALAALALIISAPAVTSGADERYNEIIKRGNIRIGISVNYPPLNYESGKKGAEITMAREFAAFIGVEPVFVPLEVHEYVSAIVNNKVDIVIASMSRNLTRAKSIWFSRSYITMTPGVLASRGALPQTRFGDQFEQPPLKTIWDLKRINRFRFAVKKQSSYEELLIEHFPNNERVYYETNDEGLDLLSSGRVDGLLHDSLYLQHLYGQRVDIRKSYSVLYGGNLTEQICAGIPFGEHTLKVQIDTFIEELLRTGKINSWLNEYR